MEVRALYKTFMVFSAFVGLGAASWVLLSASAPRETRSDYVLKVDISDLTPGELKLYSSPSKHRIMVLRRSEADLENLKHLSGVLRDPNSERSRQPETAKNIFRSVNPEYFVAFSKAERLPYAVEYVPGRIEAFGFPKSEKWFGGFVNKFEGEIYDKAGRVYSTHGVEEKNLSVPNHRFISKSVILVEFIGEKT